MVLVALFIGLNGADVSVTDINPDAVENAKYNFEKHGIDAKTYCGDMYEPLPKEARFDFIFWNHPFNRGDDPNEETLLKSGFDFQYASLEKYIAEAYLHLNPNGRILLGTGKFALLSEVEQIAASSEACHFFLLFIYSLFEGSFFRRSIRPQIIPTKNTAIARIPRTPAITLCCA